jgi:hypothetical protein
MRGQAEFGWDDKGGSPDAHKANGHVNGNGK